MAHTSVLSSTMLMLFFSAALLQMGIVEGQEGPVRFTRPALSSKTKCVQLSRNDCIFYHEAQRICPTICDRRIKYGDTDDDGPRKKVVATGATGKKQRKGCLHGSDVVITKNGPAKISDIASRPTSSEISLLSSNDQGQLGFSTVTFWTHKDPVRTLEFLILETSHGQKVSLTFDHLIYEADCVTNNDQKRRAIFAQRLTRRKCVWINWQGQLVKSQVVNVSYKMKTGIYAPVTQRGNLLVNGVLVSSFACLENEQLQKIIYQYLEWTMRLFSTFFPKSALALFYGSLSVDEIRHQMGVPELLFSFWDLAKRFMQ